jgi:hypothetical protein
MTLQTQKVSEINEHPDLQFHISEGGPMMRVYSFEGRTLISPVYNIDKCNIVNYFDESNYEHDS